MSETRARTAMVIDDDDDVRAVVTASMSIVGGWDVEGYGSAATGLAAAREHTPDLFVLDVMMPETDGVTLFKQIRRDAALRDVPVVFLTAKAAPLDAAEYLSLGALGVIVKPFDPGTLASELENILEKGHEAAVHWPKDWHDTTP